MNTTTRHLLVVLALALAACAESTTAPLSVQEPPPNPPTIPPPTASPAPSFAWAGPIAFVRDRGDEGSGIFIVRESGAPPVRLVAGTRPAWSPDGRSLAYESWNGHSVEIRAIDVDGTNDRRIAGNFTHMPAWSPDAARVAFGRDGQIYVANADGSGERRLIGIDSLAAWTGFGSGPNDSQYMWGPAWSPDGGYLAVFAFGSEGKEPVVLVANADGSGRMPGAPLPRAGAVSTIDWSPDGTRLVFTRSVETTPGSWAQRLVTVEVGTWAETEYPFEGAWPRWSADGTAILYTSPPPWSCGAKPCDARVWAVNPETGERGQVVPDDESGTRRYTDSHAVPAPARR